MDARDPDLRDILGLMGPGTLGLAAVQINVFVNTYLATSQEQGAVSWLSYAFRLMYLPIGLFGVSIATAAVPEIARHAAAADVPAVRRTVSSAMRMMLMLNVPATVGLVVLAQPTVALLLQRHAFTAADSAATAAALMFYAPGLLGYSAVKIASPTFYSLRDSRTPVVISVLAVIVNLGTNLVLVRFMGFRGLALGTSLASMFNAVALLWLLNRKLEGIELARIGVAFGKILCASMLMGIAAYAASSSLGPATDAARLGARALQVFGAIAAGLVVLVLSARLFRIAEFDDALRQVLTRVAPRS